MQLDERGPRAWSGCTWSRRPTWRPTWRRVSENWGNFGGATRSARPRRRPAPSATPAPTSTAGRQARFEEWIANDRGRAAGRRSTSSTRCCRTCPGSTCPTRAATGARPTTRSRGSRTSRSSGSRQLDVLLQRHFLQTGFADHELQRLWRHLKREGMWDKSLIVVAADHGVAFQQAPRAAPADARDTAVEIAPVPLLIKAPGPEQGRGRRRLGGDDRHPADDLRRARTSTRR